MTAPGLRRLLQPGPIAHERIESLEGRGEALEMSLEPRLNLIEAIARPLLAAGFEGAAVRLEGGSLKPFTYLIPAASTDSRYAAYYSKPFTPAGETRLEVANVTVGRRDGQPFLHCHGLWIEADGRRRGGHPIPDQTFVASSPKVQAWAFSDVALRSEFDPETNFTLFHPVPIDRPAALRGGTRTVAARVRPNEDVSESVEAICRKHGFAAAVVRGGIGSVIDPVFERGESVESDSTE